MFLATFTALVPPWHPKYMDTLPSDLIFEVFRKLSSEQRRCVLPLVCKSWRYILSHPSILWRNIDVDIRQQNNILSGPVQQFFKARSEQLQSLHLAVPAAEAGFAALVLAALGNEPPVKRLVVDFGGAEAASTATFLAQLGWMRQLKVLGICNLQGPVTTTQLFGLRRLHHLRALKLSFERGSPPNLPDGFPTALLLCSKLEGLHIYSAGEYAFRMMPESLSRLSRLRELVLDACGVHGFSRSLAQMTNLESLTVINPNPPRHMKLPKDLSALTQLTVVDVACREVPAALGSLLGLQQLTLRGLRPSCRGSHDVEREFQTLLEVIELESLSLLNCRLGAVPSAVTLHQSLRRLAVRGCGLTHLTPGPYLEFLRELDLRENGLSSAPEEALAAPLLDFLYVTDGEIIRPKAMDTSHSGSGWEKERLEDDFKVFELGSEL